MTQAFNLSQLANNLNTSGQLDATDGLTGAVPVANGGTGQSTLTANAVLLGNGTSGVQAVAPSTSGNVLVSNGTTWVSQAPSGGGVTSLNGQTGAITNTTSGSIGSYICCYFNIGSQSVGQVSHGGTYAGSSAYRFRYFTDTGAYGMWFAGQVYVPISGCTYQYQPVWKSNTSSSQITGLSLSGTWRLLSYFVSDNNYDSGLVVFGMFVRVS